MKTLFKTLVKILCLVMIAVYFTACGEGGGGGGGASSTPVSANPTIAIPISTTTSTTTTSTSTTTTTTVPVGPYTFGGGQGTLAAPYIVQNATDFDHIRDFPAAYFWINNPINMAGVNFAPIPVFSGVVYGNSHTISNLTITYTGAGKAAIAQTLSGTFTSMDLHIGTISGLTYAAIWAGDMTATGMISGCTANSFTITSPSGGNGFNTGVGQIPYVTKVLGSYTAGTSISGVTFNGFPNLLRSY